MFFQAQDIHFIWVGPMAFFVTMMVSWSYVGVNAVFGGAYFFMLLPFQSEAGHGREQQAE